MVKREGTFDGEMPGVASHDETVATDPSSANVAPDAKLHSIRGIGWAAFFGGILPAGILLALNYHRLGMSRNSRLALALACLNTMGLLTAVFLVPDHIHIPNSLIYIPLFFTVLGTAKTLQGQLLSRHHRAGGSFVSSWRSIGVALLTYPVMFGFVCALILLEEASYGTALVIDGCTVYIADGVNQEEAVQLAERLADEGYFARDETFVQFGAQDDIKYICFPLVEGAWADADVKDYYRDLGSRLAASLGWDRVSVRLTDTRFYVHEDFLVKPEAADPDNVSEDRTFTRKVWPAAILVAA